MTEELTSDQDLILPQVELIQEDHKLFAVMGWNKRYAAIRIPRHILQMDVEEQKWFLDSQGISKKLLTKVGILGRSSRAG